MLRPLTALRFAAALLVFPWHAAASRSIAMNYSLGYAGVTFFYVLSGFILTYNYEGLFRGGLTKEGVRSFWVARFARVYPAHLCAMIFTIGILLLIGGDHWSNAGWPLRISEIAAQTVLLQSWLPWQDVHFGINGPAWSISVELFFYALFPLLIVGISRCVKRASSTLILCLGALLWAAWTLLLLHVHAVFDQWSLYVFPPSRLLDFALGVLLALAFMRRTPVQRVRFDPTVLEITALVGFTFAIALSALLPQSLRFSAAFLPAAAFAIYTFANDRGSLSRFLASPALVRLGEASYAFYLIHLNVVHVIEHTLGPARHVVEWFLSLVLAVGASLLMFTYVETPARRRIRAFGERVRGGGSAGRSIELQGAASSYPRSLERLPR